MQLHEVIAVNRAVSRWRSAVSSVIAAVGLTACASAVVAADGGADIRADSPADGSIDGDTTCGESAVGQWTGTVTYTPLPDAGQIRTMPMDRTMELSVELSGSNLRLSESGVGCFPSMQDSGTCPPVEVPNRCGAMTLSRSDCRIARFAGMYENYGVRSVNLSTSAGGLTLSFECIYVDSTYDCCRRDFAVAGTFHGRRR